MWGLVSVKGLGKSPQLVGSGVGFIKYRRFCYRTERRKKKKKALESGRVLILLCDRAFIALFF